MDILKKVKATYNLEQREYDILKVKIFVQI